MREITPPIWRLLRVQASMRLARLHEVLQIAFEWENYHLYEFQAGERRIGIPDDEWDDEYELGFEDAEKVRLRDVLKTPGAAMLYRYDFGDGWEHDVVLVASGCADPAEHYPRVLAGERRPKEDCGGANGYARMVAILRDPSHEEHDSMQQWVGRDFDPEGSRMDFANRLLREYAPRWKRTARTSGNDE